MELLEKIILDLTDSEKTITSPLLKTKVLARKLKNELLENWVEDELTGYKDDTTLPKYRVASSQLVASYVYGGTIYKNQPMSTLGLKDDVREKLNHIRFFQGVQALEAYQHEKGEILAVKLPPEITQNFSKFLEFHDDPFFNLIELKQKVASKVIIQILGEIRTRLLNLLLRIDEEFGNTLNLKKMAEDTKSEEKLNTIINQTVINNTGDGNIVNTGKESNITNNVTIQKKNKEELVKKLEDINVPTDDITDLVEIIDLDPLEKDNKLGPKVKNWLLKMYGKTLDGTWDVGTDIATETIGTAVKSYFGL